MHSLFTRPLDEDSDPFYIDVIKYLRYMMEKIRGGSVMEVLGWYQTVFTNFSSPL